MPSYHSHCYDNSKPGCHEVIEYQFELFLVLQDTRLEFGLIHIAPCLEKPIDFITLLGTEL